MQVLAILFAIAALASGQGGGAQQRSLKNLGRMSNGTLVENSRCTTNDTTTDLFCNFTDSIELIVNRDTNVTLQKVKFQICLCDSAMTVAYTLTNGTVVTRKCNQCPVPVRIDRLLLENDFDVHKDGDNITRIAVSVKLSANDPGNPVTVFNNNVSLNQQDMDCNGTISPPSSCDSPTTSSVAITTSTTARRTTTMKTNTRIDYKNIYIPIICVFFVLAVLAAVGVLAIIYYLWKKNRKAANYGFEDQSQKDERKQLKPAGAV